MKALFRPKALLFAALAISLGSTTGVVLASHSVARSHALGSVAVRLAGQAGEPEASPEPIESPQAEPAEAEPTPTAALAAEPEAEPNEAVEPAEPAEEPTPTPTSGTAITMTQTFTLTGGTVTLSCTGANPIRVDSVSPNPGFTVEESREDGDRSVEIRFESSSHESRLQADCSGGQVQLLELEEKDS